MTQLSRGNWLAQLLKQLFKLVGCEVSVVINVYLFAASCWPDSYAVFNHFCISSSIVLENYEGSKNDHHGLSSNLIHNTIHRNPGFLCMMVKMDNRIHLKKLQAVWVGKLPFKFSRSFCWHTSVDKWHFGRLHVQCSFYHPSYISCPRREGRLRVFYR